MVEEYDSAELEIILECLVLRGYRLMEEDKNLPIKRRFSRVNACNTLRSGLKKKLSLRSSDLASLEPSIMPEAGKALEIAGCLIDEVRELRNVLFDIDLLDIPRYLSDEDIREFLEARLKIGR